MIVVVKVLIIGAGVGGLAAARALRKDDHDITVFEQAPALRTEGAAVTLWSNGTGILSDLNVTLDGAGAHIDVLEQHQPDGTLLASVNVKNTAVHYGHPNICLPRARLLERLADGIPVQFNKACTKIIQASTGPHVEFADGSTAEGDILVGADGRGSVVRDQLWGKDPAEPTGWATWQGVSPIDTEITGSRRGAMFTGPVGTCGLMPAGDGLLQWWFDQRWTPGKQSPRPQDSFRTWTATPVREVLAKITDEETGFFPHYRHRVPRVWGEGWITLLGDAAHSMPPTRAQGANQALEDAWLLRKAVRENSVQALRHYERTRSAKAGRVAREAGREDINKYRPWLVKLLPDALTTRYYTRWIGQISDYLTS